MTTPVRHSWVGQHAMNGSRQGLTLKTSFPDEVTAQGEADKVNATQDPGNPLRPYPCAWTDDREWTGTADHWHNGRDRARRPAPGDDK